MNKCTTPCIYYIELHDKNKKPSVKIVCDYRDGEEIKNIPETEINNCKHYKTFKDLKLNKG